MKFRIFITALICIAPTLLMGQRFYGGLKVGLNASQIDGDYSGGYHKPGITGGVWIQTDLSDKSYLGMEIAYSQKGSRKTPQPKYDDYTNYVFRASYVDLPLIYGYRILEGFDVFAGVGAGILTYQYEYDNYGLIDNFNDYEEIELSTLAGAKIEMRKLFNANWADRFKIDIRWQLSLLPARYEIEQSRDQNLISKVFYRTQDKQYHRLISTTLVYRLGKLPD